MAKPIFNPTQYELRNELPVVVSEEQATQIAQATSRVNEQLNWVAQILGWNGANYWDSLANTVHQKRALLGGTFGVYNSYTILRLKEIQTINQLVITEKQPNIQEGQRVIIGDQQTYIYSLTENEDSLALNLGELSDTVIGYLQQGAAIKVDCPQNRPFPFYRPTPEASADAYFRCSLGATVKENDFYRFTRLVLSPFSQGNTLLPYENLQLFAGSYYYFDRAVYISQGTYNLAPWIEALWIESKGLWQIYIPQEVIGNQLTLVWDYATGDTPKRVLATADFQVVEWVDPSDWGEGGDFFNPVLDQYILSRTYNIAGLNYSLGSRLALGDQPPILQNNLWYDAGTNKVYALSGGEWSEVGRVVAATQLSGEQTPPPVTYNFLAGNIWQSPENRVYIWDAGFESYDFFYFFPTGIVDGFFYFDPTYQNVQGLYFFDPSNLLLHCSDYVDSQGFYVYNCNLDDEGFYVNSPCFSSPDWYEVEFYSGSSFSNEWMPAYASNLYVLVGGVEAPSPYVTENYEVTWAISGNFLSIQYRALTELGELVVPQILVGSRTGVNTDYIDVSTDFTARPEVVTSVPYSEIGPLNNFRGVWGNKGGARSMDFSFDALDIHGYNEQQALMLREINQVLSFDFLLNLVSGSNIYTGDSPPAVANIGDYYWNNEEGVLAVYYEDRDRNKIWIEVDYPISPCQIGNPECDYFPLKPFLSTGGCVLSNGDTWQDPDGPAVTLWYDSPNGVSSWVELNWNFETGAGWVPTTQPSLVPDYSVLSVLLTDDFIPLAVNEPYTNDDYTFYYTIEPLTCTFTFHYKALSPAGVQKQPTVWIANSSNLFPPRQITEYVYSNAEWYLAPAVQNSEWTLRPWKSVSLEVTTETELEADTYANPLRADNNLGPGDQDWARSFIRLPSEYGRESSAWNQTRLVMQDMAYFGTSGDLREMRCPTQDSRPQIYEEVYFYRKDPSVGSLLFSAPFLYSDVEGVNNLYNYFSQEEVAYSDYFEADFDFVTDNTQDEWFEADFADYDPLHYRTVITGGEWDGVYLEPTGNRPISGFPQQDLRVKSVIPVPPPVWDASIYKYPPLCPQGPESYVEDPNNFKVGYAYFAADLAASEDGFFDQSQDVAWRQPLVENQTLYVLET